MLHTFYSQKQFFLVWSEPTRTIAKRLGISDVGLAKACRRADLLLPPRGYWAKLAAGKTVKKPQLARRGPGMSDPIVLGRDRGAGDRIKWTIEAGQRRLILEGVGGWCDGLSDVGGSP